MIGKKTHKMKKKLTAAIIAVLLCFPSVSFCQEKVSLGLDEAIALALRQNREILIKAEDIRKAKAQLSQEKASLLPSVTLTSSFADNRGYASKDYSSDSEQVSLKQNLYTGGKTSASIKYSEFAKTIAEAVFDRTKIELVDSVKKTYYSFVLAEELASLNSGILENTREHLEYVRIKYASGEASYSELLQMESSLAEVENTYEESVNQLESCRVLLNELLYLDKDAQIQPADGLDYRAKDYAYDQAFVLALQNRPEIRQYEAQVRQGRESIEKAKAESRPTIYASWDYYSRSHSSLTTQRNRNDYNVVGITLSWPIFDGWASRRKVEQAVASLSQARLSSDKAVRDVLVDVKQAYLMLKDALSGLKASSSEISVYLDNYMSAKEKYKEGIISSLELADSALKYRISLFGKKQAAYDYLVAASSFQRATGGI